ncbi:hypothetical protein [Cysteiniphilum sp. JM-1]|uniref:hypothetical protein n=1 Tax=Cysteiniphilum sp. JM-1 TaxID=2610891 RepID=UPI001245A21E|nr:hypothetical protein [Cysteiniphilum sp. JM-1]
MTDIKQLRKKFTKLLNDFVKHKEVSALETKIFDHVVSRRDFLVGTAKFTAVAALLSKGILPSAWANSESDIDVQGAKVHIPDTLKAEVNEINSINVSSDMFTDSFYFREMETVSAEDLECTLESTQLVMQQESFPGELQSNLLASTMLNVNEHKTFGIPEIVKITPLMKDSEGKLQQNVSVMLEIENKYQAYEEHEFDIQVSTNNGAFEFNKVVATNGNNHNHIVDGKVQSQKLIACAHVFKLDTDGEAGIGKDPLGKWSQFLDTMDEKANLSGDPSALYYTDQLAIIYENEAYEPSSPIHEGDNYQPKFKVMHPLQEAINFAEINETFLDGIGNLGGVKSEGGVNVQLFGQIGKISDRTIRMTIDHIGSYKDSSGRSCVYGTVRLGFFWKAYFETTLDGCLPGKPPETKVILFEIDESHINQHYVNFQQSAQRIAPISQQPLRPYVQTLFAPSPCQPDIQRYGFKFLASNCTPSSIPDIGFTGDNEDLVGQIFTTDLLSADIEKGKNLYTVFRDGLSYDRRGYIQLPANYNKIKLTLSDAFKNGAFSRYFKINSNEYPNDRTNGLLPLKLIHDITTTESLLLGPNDDLANIVYSQLVGRSPDPVTSWLVPSNITQFLFDITSNSLTINESLYVATGPDDEYLLTGYVKMYFSLNNQSLIQVLGHHAGFADPSSYNLLLWRQTSQKQYFNQYLTATSSIGFYDPIAINTNILRVLPWQYYFNNTDYLVCQNSSGSDPEKSLSKGLHNRLKVSPKTTYVRNVQDPIKLDWTRYKYNVIPANATEEEVIKYIENDVTLHTATFTCYNAYNLPVYNDDSIICVALQSPALVSNITNPNNVVSYNFDRSSTIYCKPNAQGNVVLQFKMPSDSLTQGVNFTYQKVSKSTIRSLPNSRYLVYKPGENFFDDLKSYSSGQLSIDRSKDYERKSPNPYAKDYSMKKVYDDQLKSSKDYSSDQARAAFHSKVEEGIKKIGGDTLTTEKRHTRINLLDINSIDLSGGVNSNKNLTLISSSALLGYKNRSVEEYITSMKGLRGSQALTSVFSDVWDAVSAAWNFIKKAIDYIKSQLDALMDKIVNNLGFIGDFIKCVLSFVQSLVNMVLELVLKLIILVLEFLFSLIWPDGWEIAGKIESLLSSGTKKFSDSLGNVSQYLNDIEKLIDSIFNNSITKINQNENVLSNNQTTIAIKKASSVAEKYLSDQSQNIEQVHSVVSNAKFTSALAFGKVSLSTNIRKPSTSNEDVLTEIMQLVSDFMTLAIDSIPNPLDLLTALSSALGDPSKIEDFINPYVNKLSSDAKRTLEDLINIFKTLSNSLIGEIQDIINQPLLNIQIDSGIANFFGIDVKVESSSVTRLGIFICMLSNIGLLSIMPGISTEKIKSQLDDLSLITQGLKLSNDAAVYQKDLWVTFHYIYSIIGVFNGLVNLAIGEMISTEKDKTKSAKLVLGLSLYGLTTSQIYSILPSVIDSVKHKTSQLDLIDTFSIYAPPGKNIVKMAQYPSFLTNVGYASSLLGALLIYADYSLRDKQLPISLSLGGLSIVSLTFLVGTIAFNVRDNKYFTYKSIPFSGYFFSSLLLIDSVALNAAMATKNFEAIPIITGVNIGVGLVGGITAAQLSGNENNPDQEEV